MHAVLGPDKGRSVIRLLVRAIYFANDAAELSHGTILPPAAKPDDEGGGCYETYHAGDIDAKPKLRPAAPTRTAQQDPLGHTEGKSLYGCHTQHFALWALRMIATAVRLPTEVRVEFPVSAHQQQVDELVDLAFAAADEAEEADPEERGREEPSIATGEESTTQESATQEVEEKLVDLKEEVRTSVCRNLPRNVHDHLPWAGDEG